MDDNWNISNPYFKYLQETQDGFKFTKPPKKVDAQGNNEAIIQLQEMVNQLTTEVNILKKQGEGFKFGDIKASMQDADHDQWMLLDGRQLSIFNNPKLYALIGDDFNFQQDDSSAKTYFRLPNAKGRTLAGVGKGVGLGPFDTRPHELTHRNKSYIGEEKHRMTISEMPIHTPKFYVFSNDPRGNSLNRYSARTVEATNYWLQSGEIIGGDQPFNIMQPTLFCGNFFIYVKSE